MKLIEKLKYIRNPCKKCLVDPMCGNRCDKFLAHLQIKNNSFIIFMNIVIGLSALSLVYIAGQLLYRFI
jgi:hypothetical protein